MARPASGTDTERSKPIRLTRREKKLEVVNGYT
jgi:hypothetical protein